MIALGERITNVYAFYLTKFIKKNWYKGQKGYFIKCQLNFIKVKLLQVKIYIQAKTKITKRWTFWNVN